MGIHPPQDPAELMQRQAPAIASAPMSTHAGIHRIKIVWAVVYGLAAFSIIALLLLGRTPLTQVHWLLLVAAAWFGAMAPLMHTSLKNRVALGAGIPFIALVSFSNGTRDEVQALLTVAVVGVIGAWLLWSAAQWVWAGFKS